MPANRTTRWLCVPLSLFLFSVVVSSLTSGVSFWEVAPEVGAVRQVGKIPSFHFSEASPLSLCAQSLYGGRTEIVAIGWLNAPFFCVSAECQRAVLVVLSTWLSAQATIAARRRCIRLRTLGGTYVTARCRVTHSSR